MIKFWFHEYKLTPLLSTNSLDAGKTKKGFLLKIQNASKRIGYSDVFPVSGIDEHNAQYHLRQLQKKVVTPLVEQSIWMAKKDAELRSENIEAIDGISKIKNHFLVSDLSKMPPAKMLEVKQAGFTSIKVKVGRDWKEEINWIEKVISQYSFTLRMDFNSKSDFSTFERMITSMKSQVRSKIEFVEDPFPWNYDEWKEASSIAPLALDFEYKNVEWNQVKDDPPFKVVIIKPYHQDVDQMVDMARNHRLKMVITTSMGHPLTIIGCLKIAAELKNEFKSQVLDCGCQTHRLYKPDAYSKLINFTGPFLTAVKGTGFGFDAVLENLDWKPLELK